MECNFLNMLILNSSLDKRVLRLANYRVSNMIMQNILDRNFQGKEENFNITFKLKLIAILSRKRVKICSPMYTGIIMGSLAASIAVLSHTFQTLWYYQQHTKQLATGNL